MDELIEELRIVYTNKKLSRNTVKSYLLRLKQFIDFYKIQDITDMQVYMNEMYVEQFFYNRRWNKRTISRYTKQLLNIFDEINNHIDKPLKKTSVYEIKAKNELKYYLYNAIIENVDNLFGINNASRGKTIKIVLKYPTLYHNNLIITNANEKYIEIQSLESNIFTIIPIKNIIEISYNKET